MSTRLYIALRLSMPGKLYGPRLARRLLEVRGVRRRAEPLRLLALDPFEENAQIADRLVHVRLDVPELREALGDRRHREVLGLDLGQLVPRDRGRDGRIL